MSTSPPLPVPQSALASAAVLRNASKATPRLRLGKPVAAPGVTAAKLAELPAGLPRHVVIGAGPVARALAEALLAKGIAPHLVSRSTPSRPLPMGCTHSQADAHDVRAMRALLEQATVLYNCAQPHTARWNADYVALARAIARAAAHCQLPLVVPQSTEALGRPWASVLTNRHPIAPVSRRGRLMAQAATELYAMRSTHALKFSIVRAENSVGPGITGGALGYDVFRAALRFGKSDLLLHALFNPAARQTLSRYYMYSNNYILGGSDLQKRLAQQATPMLEAVTRMLAWFRQHD